MIKSRATRIRFNEELLTEYLQRDNAVFLSNSGNINGESIIAFSCTCGEETGKSFYSIVRDGGAFCKLCINNNKLLKYKNTCNERYSTDNTMQVNVFKDKVIHSLKDKRTEIKIKRENTMMQKYGNKYASKIEQFREKTKNTCLNIYNTTNPLLNKDILNKIKETNIKKYGTENVFSNKEIQDKIIQSNLNKRGVKYAFQSEEVKKKIKETCLEKYGYEFACQNEEIKTKLKTNLAKVFLEKYGCHPQQTSEIHQRTRHNSLKFKDYKMPSGNIRKIQGYEDKALDELSIHFNEDDIITNRELVPRIKYVYNDTYHYYFPDIYLKSINKIIEVKSDYTMTLDIDKILLKSEATKKEGYNYEIWIYSRNGNKRII